MKFYFDCFKKSLHLFLIVLLCLTIEVALEMSLPFLMAHLLDNGVKAQNFDVVVKTSLLMIGFALLAVVLGIISMKISAIITNDFSYEVRRRVFHRIQEFSFKNIDHFEVPSLVTRLTSDVNVIRMAVLMLIRAGIKAPLMMLAGAVFMFILNVKLAALVLLIGVVLCVLIVFIIFKATPQFGKTQGKYDKVNEVVEENTEAIRVVKSFVRENLESEKFAVRNNDLCKTASVAYKIANINIPLILLAANLCNVLILALGGIDVAKGSSFTTGQLSSFINFSTTVMMSFNMVSGLIMNLARASASKTRIDMILNEEIDIPYDHKVKTIDFDPNYVKDGSVEFKSTTFSYVNDEEKLAVGPVDLKVKSGEIVGIIGGTGAGKTTLISLIPRLYDCLGGEVLVGGKNVKDYDLLSLRDSIGVVTQKNVLFSGTIRDNIKWGKPDASDEEIEEALRVVQARDFVFNFKDGLDTKISQGGNSVSGGQKQRLSIARAIIKNPKILILDDSTSAVDVHTESKIKEAFYKELKGTTIFIIAQRISSIEDADKILVLDNGKVESIGRHGDLVKTSKVYQEIYETQKKGVLD